MRSYCAALVLALSAAGCGGSGEGTVFRLVRSASDTLPIRLMVEESCLTDLDSATVVFDRRGEYRSVFHIRRRCSNSPGRPEHILEGTEGSVTVRNDTAFFRDSLANPAGFGVLTADSLIVQGPSHRLIYVRQFSNPR